MIGEILYRIRYTPLTDALHGNWTCTGDSLKTVRDSALPEPAKQLLIRVIRRTRLWRRERAEVAVELMAHFADGLDAGRNVDDLLATFGNERQAAKLIRRGKRRNRPLWWHVQHRLGQCIGVFVCVYVLLGIGMLFEHANPNVDYLAQLNATALSAKPEDSAWPIYRDAWLSDDGKWIDGMKVFDVKDSDHLVGPSDPGWPAAVEFLHKHRTLLDGLRSVAGKPHFGLVSRLNIDDYPEPDRRALLLDISPSQPAPPHNSADQPLMQSMLNGGVPYLNRLRSVANLLMEDQKLADVEGDAKRAIEDYAAVLATARHAHELPLLVNQLEAIGCVAMADAHLVRLLHTHPALFAGQEAELAHQMAQASRPLSIDFRGEQTFWLYIIQRSYTDNGHGGGHALAPLFDTNGLDGASKLFGAVFFRPAAAVIMMDRATLTSKVDQFFNAAQTETVTPYWLRRQQNVSLPETLDHQWNSPAKFDIPYLLLSMLAPSDERAIETGEQVKSFHESVIIVVAVQTFHREQGHYPATLADLVPHYLPAVPLDMRTGGPLTYCLKDGQPFVYGHGEDDQDHGGVWSDKPECWPNMPRHGDWVFYPPPTEQ